MEKVISYNHFFLLPSPFFETLLASFPTSIFAFPCSGTIQWMAIFK
jgi:hypothetical protein